MVLAKILSKPIVPDFFNIYNNVRAYINIMMKSERKAACDEMRDSHALNYPAEKSAWKRRFRTRNLYN